MKKFLASAILLAAVLAPALAGGSSQEPAQRPVTVSLATGATALSVAQMATQASFDPNYPLTWDIISSADGIAARLISGEADLAIVPTNLAATLHNQGKGLSIVGAPVWGLLYIVGSEAFESAADLRGKTIELWGRGLTPDILLRHLLTQAGLDPDNDVELRYKPSAAELAPLFLTGKADLVLVPEPVVSTILSRKPGATIALDLQAEWGRVSGSTSSYPQAVLVGQTEFLREHSDFVTAFSEQFAQSITWLNNNPTQAGILALELMPEANAAVLAAAVPRLSLEFKSALQAKSAIEDYLQVLIQADAGAIGGGLPNASFYFAP